MNAHTLPQDQWLTWARRLQALAQSGLAYTQNPFEIERYNFVREIAFEILAAHSELAVDQVRDLFSGEGGYATPKVDVRGVVFRPGPASGRDGMLLVRELRDGLWTLPGGWADVGDSPAEATVREVYEESGYQTRAVKLLACYDRNKHGHPPRGFHIYKLFFQCELLGGEATSSVETADAAFFCEDEIPALSLPRVTPEQIARFFAHRRHPEWPTDFD
jgi:ADP-ribose pyrophosphatase YjhB (NUDIX family)